MPARVTAFLHQVNVSHFSFSNRIKKLDLLLFQENTYGSYQRFLSVIIVYCTWLFFMLLTLHPGCTGSWRLPPALSPTLIAFSYFFYHVFCFGCCCCCATIATGFRDRFLPSVTFHFTVLSYICCMYRIYLL